MLAVFLAPGPARASTALSSDTQLVLKADKPKVKNVLKWLIRPNMFHDPAARGFAGDGAVMGLLSIILFVLNIGCWFINPFLGLLTTLPLGVAGVILGITGFNKGWRHRSKKAKILSVIGLALNAAIVLAFLILIYWT